MKKQQWRVENQGLVIVAPKRTIGFFDINGNVYGPKNVSTFGDPFGSPIGFVDTAGNVFTQARLPFGIVDVNGIIYDSSHTPVAQVTATGFVFKMNGMLIGIVNRNLHSKDDRPEWRPMIYRAAAAVLLLLDIENFKRIPKSAPK